ncbi:unnamed protein product [Mytilus edulis]|uniref:TTF-type domain-containing protein n=1 Tax=Mytilus edulis TaxID=6550 RepID=A0A8S3SNE0_MYTED|nr:unnamed protein product [Mytilus edulis]
MKRQISIQSFFGSSSKRPKSVETQPQELKTLQMPNQPQKAVEQSESDTRSQCLTPNDVTSWFGRTLNNDEKYTIYTKGVTIPDTFKFPSTKIADKNRCFRKEWISKYPGLVYSIEEDGAYCLHCVLFEKEPEKRGKLVNAPFKNWKKALEVFDEHFWGKSTKSLKRGGRAVDVVSALESVSLVKEALQDVRDNIGEFHAKWYSQILKMADDLDVTPSKPRTCGRQTTRSNVPCESTEDYYKKTIAIPLLDHMLTEMNSGLVTCKSRHPWDFR